MRTVLTDPQTSVLPRRIAASAIDLFLVLLIWGLVLYRLTVRFEIAQRNPEGQPIYSDFQRASLERIDEGVNFGTTIGDYYYSLHGRGLVLGVLSLIMFSLIAWVLVPANTGWSVGHRMFNLKVTDVKGDKPPLDSYVRRYLVGSVDLFPYIVPGLLGWIVAARNERHQRLGDLSADTMVVDASVHEPGAEGSADAPPAESETSDTKGSASVEASEVPPPPVVTAITTTVDVEQALAASTPTGEGDYPVLDLEETVDSSTTSGDLPVGEGATLSSVFVESLEEHEARTGSAFGWRPQGVEGEAQEPELPTASHAAAWHFPEAKEAPVWTPEPSTDRGPRPVKVEAQVSEPTQGAPRGEPVWNEQWAAWLFWDVEGRRWLRHDPSRGWTPIEDSQNA